MNNGIRNWWIITRKTVEMQPTITSRTALLTVPRFMLPPGKNSTNN